MIVLFVILSLLADPQLPAGVTCDQIKSLVAEHGKAKALAWAIRQGYSWPQIRAAKRCL